MQIDSYFSVLILVLIHRTKVSAFNIDQLSPIVKKVGSSEGGSYFGFSVALHKEEEKDSTLEKNWILVGAPLGHNLQPGTNRSGALFKCPITNDPCIQVVTDGSRLENFDYDEVLGFRESEPLNKPGPDEIKDGQWLGVTVKSQKPGGKVIVCAHRYVQSEDLQRHHYGWGLCYLLDHNLKTEEALVPCKGRAVEKLHQQYGFCQVGTSLSLLHEGFALMGSPGPYTWRGTIFAKQVVGSFLSQDTTVYRGPLNDDPEPIDKYSYLGMSVTGGRFFPGEKATVYVSGAPRSNFSGEVFFFNRTDRKEELQLLFKIKGEQFGSSFGYEILATDINGDGVDDLLVAAPFYYMKEHGGAVYVYTNLQEKENSAYSILLEGKIESRFGFAMTSLGDINKDGYNDVAIGAPYDDGGAVYIYLGSKDGFKDNNRPSQVIRNRGVRTLGYSLSGGLDMDLNDYPDLLVGAYESDMAILFRTRPIIDIKIKIRDENQERTNINTTRKGCKLDRLSNNTCFSFKSCFTLSKFTFQKSFKVKYSVKEVSKRVPRIWIHDPQHVYNREHTKEAFIDVTNIEKEYCQRELIYIKDGIGDILSPLQFVVNYTLENERGELRARKSLEPSSPILNQTSVKTFEATFQKSCGADDVCESKLILNAGTLLKKTEDGFILDLGKNKEFHLDANVTNEGESAYEAKLFVIHPETLSYIALQNKGNIICAYHNDTMVICNLGNPFPEHAKAKLRLRFEIKDTKEQRLALKVFVNSTSTELSKKTSESFTAILQKIAEIRITGKALTPPLFYGGEIKGESAMRYLEDIGARVYHIYEITNQGQWNIQGMRVSIFWPYQVNSGRAEGGKWLLYLEENPTIDFEPENFCSVDPPNAVNPLNLNSSGLEKGDPDNFTQPLTFMGMPEKVRRRRDVEKIVQPKQIVDLEGKDRNVVRMDCEGTALCVVINCKISRVLSKTDPIKIKIRSRIWNSTLTEDYTNSKVDWVSIRSFAKVTLNDLTFVKSNDSILSTGIETVAYPRTVAADTSLNIWIICGAVLLGLLLLIVLIAILYKVGFFKRHRVKDHTLSGNLKKQGESETLMDKDNNK